MSLKLIHQSEAEIPNWDVSKLPGILVGYGEAPVPAVFSSFEAFVGYHLGSLDGILQRCISARELRALIVSAVFVPMVAV